MALKHWLLAIFIFISSVGFAQIDLATYELTAAQIEQVERWVAEGRMSDELLTKIAIALDTGHLRKVEIIPRRSSEDLIDGAIRLSSELQIMYSHHRATFQDCLFKRAKETGGLKYISQN